MLKRVLRRLPFYGEATDLVRRMRSPAARRTAAILRGDLAACGPVIARIAEGLPSSASHGTAMLIGSMQSVFGLKLEGVMAMMARVSGFEPLAVYLDSSPWSRRIHGVFGIHRGASFDRYLDAAPLERVPEFEPPGAAFAMGELLDLTYRRVDVGRIALSNLLYRRKFSKLDLTDHATTGELVEELRQIARRVRAAEALVEREHPALAMVLEKGLSPSAEIFGVCVARGVDVVQYSGSQNLNDFVLRRFTFATRHQHPFSLSPDSWAAAQAMTWSPEHEAAVLRLFEHSYRTGAWFKRKYLHKDKRIEDTAATRAHLRLNPHKKTAVIFSHVLWDATFFYGRGLFDDYETWLIETVRAACRNPDVNWVVKLHPDLVWKLKYEGFTGELRDLVAMRAAVGELPPHVIIVPPDTPLSTYSFFAIADFCVTVRGTVGIEMACHGVPVITAGTGRYSGLGFTIDSATAAEYLDRLANLDRQPPMDTARTTLARRFAHALFERRPWPMRSFDVLHETMDEIGHPLVQNVVPRVESAETFAGAADVRAFRAWLLSGAADYLDDADMVASARTAGDKRVSPVTIS